MCSHATDAATDYHDANLVYKEKLLLYFKEKGQNDDITHTRHISLLFFFLEKDRLVDCWVIIFDNGGKARKRNGVTSWYT